nr:hypothetical protein [Escherichia coli]
MRQLHPYELPELLAVEAASACPNTCNGWPPRADR